MTDRDDIRKPLDHLPPQEDREGIEIDEPDYPGEESPGGGSAVSPDTAAEPEEPARHGVAKLRPQS